MSRILSSCFFVAAFTVSLSMSSVDARAAGVDPGSASPVQREQAQQRFTRGRDLFEKKEYAKARDEFVASHDIVASPNARLFAARCERGLGRLVEAYVELGRVVVEAHELEHEDTRYTKTAESANAERAEIAPQLAFVSVTVEHATPETKLVIAGSEVVHAGWGEPLPVLPGTTEIVVETPGHANVRAAVALARAERKPVTLDATSNDVPAPVVTAPPPAPVEEERDRGSPTRAFAYAAGAVGVAGLVTFAIAGLAANGTYSDLESQCHGPCDPSKSSEISRGKTQQTIANVGLVVGAIGLGAGITLFVVSLPKSHATQTGSNASATAALTAGPGWLGVRGAF